MIQFKKLNSLLIAVGAFSVTSLAFASGFQLWEQDGASIGNYHAGYAALAEDASTGFYNPAGLTRIKKPQLVLAADLVTPHFNYSGTATSVLAGIVKRTESVTGNGGTHNLVPSFHFAYPINDRITAGLSVVGPFGLKTVYGRDNFLRTNTVYSSLSVIDVSPEIGFKINPQWSVGGGLDIERAHAEFALSAANLLVDPPAYLDSVNRADGATAYGFHLGGLFEYDDHTRVGLSYHSKVTHHLSGDSTLSGDIVSLLNGGKDYFTEQAKTNIATPAYTAFSGYHHTQGPWALMGSVIYTEWSSLENITLQNVSLLVFDGGPKLALGDVNVPQHWHNTWNVTGGVSYDLTDAFTLRAGLGYDQSPVPNAYRNLILPDNDRYVTALGFSFHPNKTITLDLGWSHYFVKEASINPPPLVTGGQTAWANGKSKGSADVFGAQITWNFV